MIVLSAPLASSEQTGQVPPQGNYGTGRPPEANRSNAVSEPFPMIRSPLAP